MKRRSNYFAARIAAAIITIGGLQAAPVLANDTPEASSNITNITINNINESAGLELGTDARARGNGSIATGTNSLAIGKNAVATGGNENKDTILTKLNENKQKLAEIATAKENTNRLLDELQTIRKTQADVIEAGERVKQVRKSKATAYDTWQSKLSTYNQAVTDSAAQIKDAQDKINDLNSRLAGLSQLPGADISSEQGLTNAATQLKGIVEKDTTLNLSLDFYKEYVANYYKAIGDLRQANLDNLLYKDISRQDVGRYLNLSSSMSVKNILKKLKNYDDEKIAVKSPFIRLNGNADLFELGLVDGSHGISIDNRNVITQYYGDSRININKLNENSTIYELPIINTEIDIVSEPVYKNVLSYWQSIWDAVPNAIANYKNPLITDTDKENMKNIFYTRLLNYKAKLDIIYYQGKYEETKDTTWLDKKVAVNVKIANEKSKYPITENFDDIYIRITDDLQTTYNNWKKENITDVLQKNKITTNKLTSELETALNINKDAILQIQNRLSSLKTAADQAKSTYDNINPSAADLALSAQYDSVMRQLTEKANQLKSEQDRLKALQDALTLYDLTNTGQNAIAVGTNALSTGTNAIALGTDTIVVGENSIALGKGSVVTGTNSIAIGVGHNVLGNNSGAFGDPDYIYGDGSYSFGNNNTIGDATQPHKVGNNTFVLGSNVTTTANNAVILGANSTGADNTVSVGAKSSERKVINMAAGTISATSTDAVNGSQIHDILQNGTNVNVANWKTLLGVGSTENSATATALSNLASDVAKHLGGGSTVDSNGRVTAPSYSITDVTGQTPTAKNYSNVGAALTALDNNTKALNNTVNTKANTTDVNAALAKKANTDASNIDTAKFAEKLGTGKVETGNTNLVTGGTVATALENKANTDLSNITDGGKTIIKNLAKGSVKVVAGTNTTVTVGTDGDATTYAVNVSADDIKEVMTTDMANKADANAGNITGDNKTAWQNALGDGKAQAGNIGLITGDTLNTALSTKADKSSMDTALAGKANVDASNINVTKFTEKLGTGKVETGNTNLVTGGTVATALETKANTNLSNLTSDGQTIIKNLAKNSVKVVAGTNTTVTTGTDGDATTYAVNVSNDDIKAAMKNDMDKKADANATNITGDNKTAWQNALGDGKVEAGNKGLITGDTLNTALSTKADKTEITNVLDSKANITDVDASLAKKANIDASNINSAKFAEKLGTGKIIAGNTNLVTGGTVATALETKANTNLSNLTSDGQTVIKNLAKGSVKVVAGTNTTVTTGTDGDATTYAVNVSSDDIKAAMKSDMDKKANVDASNLTANDVASWSAILGTGKIADGNTNLVTGGTVYNVVKNVSDSILVHSDGNTVTIDPTGSASTITISHITPDGVQGRALTGIVSNPNDPYSAVNMGTLNSYAGGLSNQMNRMNQKLTKDIKQAGAAAAALAGLHPLPYDPSNKLNFAVAQGRYRGANATALGAFYQPNEDISFNIAGTMGNGDSAYNVGVSFKVGPGNSAKRPVKQSELDALKAQNKALTDKLDALMKEVDDMKAAKLGLSPARKSFPDVPKSHWANEAVETLAGNDVIEGYSDGEFKGDKQMTRYEYAQMLYKAAK